MKVFRIERKKHLDSILQGIGAARSDGMRWNSRYTPVVYTSASRALALLEVAVNLDLSEDLPTDRYYVEIEIPEDIKISELQINNLPANWDAKPPENSTQFIGDEFVKSNTAAVLKVPSSIIQHEFNYMINPNHADSKDITVISKTHLLFDERLKNQK